MCLRSYNLNYILSMSDILFLKFFMDIYSSYFLVTLVGPRRKFYVENVLDIFEMLKLN